MSDASRFVLVVSGDSTATNHGIGGGERQRAYGALLRRSLAPEGWRVVTLTRSGRSLQTALADSARIERLSPHVVVLGHGGWEALLKFPRVLGLLRTYPLGAVPTGQPFRFARLRRIAYLPVLGALQHPLGEQLLHLVGIFPNVASAKAVQSLDALVDRLLLSTAARIVLVAPGGQRMGVVPWSRAARRRFTDHLRRRAATENRLELLDLEAELGADAFGADGVHLAAAGHARVADLLVRRLEPAAAAAYPWTASLESIDRPSPLRAVEDLCVLP